MDEGKVILNKPLQHGKDLEASGYLIASGRFGRVDNNSEGVTRGCDNL